MNKKELVAAILLVASELEKEVVTQGLDMEALTTLHNELVAAKNEALSKGQDEKDKTSFQVQDKVVLQFTAPHKRYSNGDIAGFSVKESEQILALKPAVAKTYQETNKEEK